MADVLLPELHSPPPPPPPPPTNDDRAREVDLPSPTPECDDRSPRRELGRSPEDHGVPLPPPPPLGSSRPERLASDRPEEGASAAAQPCGGRSESPTARSMWPRRLSPASLPPRGGRRSESPTPRSIWRRLSPSPPPPLPPLPPKRPRLDSRRSPPRGGRFGFEHERGRERSMNTSRRAPDCLDSGCDAPYNGQSNTRRKGLMTYKQFTQKLEDDVSPGEAESRYQEYKASYITSQKQDYFDHHKNEDRLKDMYHPTNLLSVIERRNELCKAAAKNLILDLRSGTLDLGPGMTAGTASKSGNDSDGIPADDEDYHNKRRRHHRGPLEETELVSVAPKAHPVSSHYRRIQSDIHQTLALVKKLDEEKGIVGNILTTGDHTKSNGDKSYAGSTGPLVIVRGLSTVKGLDGFELLDTLLTYLWHVHGIDYYGMSESTNAKGLRHVRADTKNANMDKSSAADWEKKLDYFWQERLTNGKDPLVALTAKDKIDASADKVLESYVTKVKDDNYGWTYGCGAKGCIKVFHAPDFVLKHLNLKHPDLVSKLTSRVQEDIYFQNYMNDPNAPGGTPVMQQQSPMMRPVMPMYPPRPPNSRRLRSYKDLDAPNDEVTLVDYRSL
uniref:C2H2-type domain-containing protein n=1 Tax=Oryza glumipatula TaxID=40148 RepID=A0A0D9YMA9_9ORYZ